MRTWSLAILAAFAICAASCKPSSTRSEGTDASTRRASELQVSAADASAKIDEDARAVLDAWQRAQNAGDFATYEALYAARFEGVRRSGAQVARLDRARWMKERERMMKQKTEVTVKDVIIVALPAGADIHFVQTWSSATYKDEGEKRIVLSREHGKLLIAREEMLRSVAYAAHAPATDTFMFVARETEPPKRGPGPPLLVLTTSVQDGWLRNPPRSRWVTAPVVVTERDVDTTKLPPEIKAWEGRSVELFGDRGVVCEGTVSGFRALGRVTPHFGVRARWTGTGDFEGEPPQADAAIASEAWSLAGGSGRALTLVVATPANEKCRSALWGRVKGAAKPDLVASEPADAVTRALAISELAKTKEYAAAQRDYDDMKEPAAPKRWELFDSKIDARVFKTRAQTFVTLSIRAGSGCGSFGATMSAAYELKGAALTPIKPPASDPFEPASAGDVDGDGAIDFVWPEGLARGKGAAIGEVHRIELPDLDCGC